ncbi:hypothetical protein [Mobilicoccus pelagius]|uniref:Uncharacterized protein n=1 Tax=Mobilicoccus pelagius NBRC 104925 TaxID=1089455 RepID=H5UPW4_9MICO|nr:hypothetical protein [Mobilicoccus pelagius]GAB47769.1 hypothetical protein MOPEL_029_00480 [Mobilicoccus pelagius NBRC 104925]
MTPRGAEVLIVGAPESVPRLPSGPLRAEHRSLHTSLRAWVVDQTGVTLGYVEQLHAFADRERVGPHHRLLSASYLGLTHVEDDAPAPMIAARRPATAFAWRPWSEFLPLGRIGGMPRRANSRRASTGGCTPGPRRVPPTPSGRTVAGASTRRSGPGW